MGPERSSGPVRRSRVGDSTLARRPAAGQLFVVRGPLLRRIRHSEGVRFDRPRQSAVPAAPPKSLSAFDGPWGICVSGAEYANCHLVANCELAAKPAASALVRRTGGHDPEAFRGPLFGCAGPIGRCGTLLFVVACRITLHVGEPSAEYAESRNPRSANALAVDFELEPDICHSTLLPAVLVRGWSGANLSARGAAINSGGGGTILTDRERRSRADARRCVGAEP